MYHKINSIFARDKRGRIMEGTYSCPEFAYLANLKWLFSEKVDGTNIRLTYPGEAGFRSNIYNHIAGRTDNAQIPPKLLSHLVGIMLTIPFEEVFGTGPVDVTLYGEGYGAGIQKGGGNYLPDSCGFVLFDIRIGTWWLRREDVADTATKLGLDVVPDLGSGTLADAVDMVRGGFPSQRWPGVKQAEGLVLRPAVELFDRGGNRVITKIKTRDFL